MTFKNVKMTPEEKELVNSWKENSKFLQGCFPFGKITESRSHITVENNQFYFLSCGNNTGPEYKPDPTYYFYLWWKEGSVDIYTKRKRSPFDENREFSIEYNIFKIYLEQNNLNYTKNFILKTIDNAFKTYKTFGQDTHYERTKEVIVNFDHVTFEGDWSN